MPLEVIYDMETGDPDDFITLLFLLGHPEVQLKAITIYPGTPEQIGLVSKAINWFKEKIPIGSFNFNDTKQCVSEWYVNTYGRIKPNREAYTAPDLLVDVATDETIIITGGNLKNLASAIKLSQDQNRRFKVGKAVIQGGFSGPNLASQTILTDKFSSKTTFPSPTFDMDRRSAWKVIRSNLTAIKKFIPINVSHQIVFDKDMVNLFDPFKRHNLALALIWKGMAKYNERHPEGKKTSNLFAACCAVNDHICSWEEVEIIREHGGWGAIKNNGTDAWIATSYNREEFTQTLLAY